MRNDTITKEIREEYTPEELSEMGKKLAGKMADIDAVGNEKKAADATFNQRRTELEKEAETLYRQINKGYEMAQIGCDIRYNDPTPGQKSYYRMDTAAHVETVDMTWEEKQEELQFKLPTAEAAPEATAEAVDQALKDLADVVPPPDPLADVKQASAEHEEQVNQDLAALELKRCPRPSCELPEGHAGPCQFKVFVGANGPGDAVTPEEPRRRRKKNAPPPPADVPSTDPPEAAQP